MVDDVQFMGKLNNKDRKNVRPTTSVRIVSSSLSFLRSQVNDKKYLKGYFFFWEMLVYSRRKFSTLIEVLQKFQHLNVKHKFQRLAVI